MRARASLVVDGRISEAEALWYDTARRPTIVDGFHHAVSADPPGPRRAHSCGTRCPTAAARVVETVLRYEPRVGQTARVEDTATTGTQEIAFAATPDERVRVTLALDWTLKERRLGPLVWSSTCSSSGRAQREALARTLVRLGRELAAEREG